MATLNKAQMTAEGAVKPSSLEVDAYDHAVGAYRSVAIMHGVGGDGNTLIPVSAPASINGFVIQELDDTTTTNVAYIGKIKDDGAWLIIKINETGSFPTWRYASIANNPTRTTYALGWANRTTLTYDYLDVI